MTAARVGVDLAHVGELDRLLEREWFRRYVFADGELRYAASVGATRAAEFLTGRFAAKEAVLKVLGSGLFEGVPPRAIELDREESGQPVPRLAGAALTAADALGITEVAVSIAHKGGDVVAVALGQVREPR